MNFASARSIPRSFGYAAGYGLAVCCAVLAACLAAMGGFGAVITGALFQSLGLAPAIALLAFASGSFRRERRPGLRARLAMAFVAVVVLSGAGSAVAVGGGSLLSRGLGGIMGEAVLDLASGVLEPLGSAARPVAGLVLLVIGGYALWRSLGWKHVAWRKNEPRGVSPVRIEPRFDSAADRDLNEASLAIARRFAPKSAARAREAPHDRTRRAKPNHEAPELRRQAAPQPESQAPSRTREPAAETARALETMLARHGVLGGIRAIARGPAVTTFEFEPAPSVTPSRIARLSGEIARAFGSPGVRIIPLSGGAAYGFELPNPQAEPVFLRDMLRSAAFRSPNAILPLAIGAGRGGAPVIADLARIGHLLVAGGAESEVSMGLDAVALSLLYRQSPESCRLLMIDTDGLNLAAYDGAAHLLAPVVRSSGQAASALAWAAAEMERRLVRMAKLAVTSIEAYNLCARAASARGEDLFRLIHTGFDGASGEALLAKETLDAEPLPRIAVLALGLGGSALENRRIAKSLGQIASSGAAAGVHLVVAARPPFAALSAMTIGGHVPARACYKVSSRIESRMAIGEPGAEQLLGDGDLLFTSGQGAAMRLCGPFASRDEILALARRGGARGTSTTGAAREPDRGAQASRHPTRARAA